MDSIVLARHIHTRQGEKILDIGTGSGILPILIALKHSDIKIIGIEIQEELASIARKNIIANHMEDTISIIRKDIKKTRLSDIDGTQDIIISNPPYKKIGSGRLNGNIQKAIANHELELSLEELIISVKKLLSPIGRFYMIYPAERCSEMIYTLCNYRIMPDQIRFIHTKKDSPAKRVIIKCINNGMQATKILPPLFI